MNGAELLVHRLGELGVNVVFGLPGEENLSFVEALGLTSINLIVVRHEQHAAFMAATHGRLTGRPGVCLATLGPGALNLFTGLAHAELGGMPVVAITGQKPLRNNREGSFQVLDVPAAARPLTRWSKTVADPREIVATIDEAFNQALDGRPGAVLVELPEDIAAEEVVEHPNPVPLRSPVAADRSAIEQAAALIDGADAPVVLVGGGLSTANSARAVTAFAERTGIGVLATQMGKGVIAESHRLSLRSLGIHRPDYSHLAIADADLVVAVGYQPVEHPPLVWNPDEDKTIVHVAPWAAGIERGYQPTHQLIGDPATVIDDLATALSPDPGDRSAAIGSTITSMLDGEDAGPAFPPSPLGIVRTLRDLLEPTDIVALDNGAYKIWFARHYACERPNTLLLDNALATMGAGLATGTEAARLHPDGKTVAVCGDGGFLMNVQDLETACRLGVDLTVLVVRDDAYGFIGWHQEEQGRPREGVELENPDIVALARAFGATGHRVSAEDDLAAVLKRSLDEPGVSVVDCPLDYGINELLDGDLHQRAIEAAR